MKANPFTLNRWGLRVGKTNVNFIRSGAANESKTLSFTRRYQDMEPVTYPRKAAVIRGHGIAPTILLPNTLGMRNKAILCDGVAYAEMRQNCLGCTKPPTEAA